MRLGVGRAGDLAIRGGFTPLIDVGQELGFRTDRADPIDGVVALIETEGGARSALVVDAIQDQRQVVIKSLEANYGHVPGIAAATILGDGRVALILDIDAIVAPHQSQRAASEILLAAVKSWSDIESKANASAREFIAFRIGAQEFCIDIMSVREIRGWTPATALPHAPGLRARRHQSARRRAADRRSRRAARLSRRPSRRRAMSSSSRRSARRSSACWSTPSPTSSRMSAEKIQPTPDVGSEAARDVRSRRDGDRRTA